MPLEFKQRLAVELDFRWVAEESPRLPNDQAAQGVFGVLSERQMAHEQH
jgi:hypothetical protein